jgi:hypothetical protein
MTPKKRYYFFIKAEGYNDEKAYTMTTKAKYQICELIKKGISPVTVYRADVTDLDNLEQVAVCDEKWWADYLQGKRGW